MTRQQKKSIKADLNCDKRQVLNRIGDKWSLVVIYKLAKGKCRFNEILRDGRGISQRMLTTTLRTCERDGLLKRYSYLEIPPRVEYELTPLGQSLLEVVEQILRWAESHWPEIESARQAYDSQQEKLLANAS